MLTVVLFTINILAIVFVFRAIAELRHHVTEIADLVSQYESEEYADQIESFLDESDTMDLEESQIQEHVLLREKSFDERIARMKDELSYESRYADTRTGTVADELHPYVYNIPHDSMIDYESNPPSIEYSE